MKKKLLFILLVLAVLFVIYILLPIDICIILWKILLICLFSYALYKCVNLGFSLLCKDDVPVWFREKKIKILLSVLCFIISTGIVMLSDTINNGFDEFKRGYDSVREKSSVDDNSHDSGDRGSFQTFDQGSLPSSAPEDISTSTDPEPYAGIFELYERAFQEGWDRTQLRDAGVNQLCAFCQDLGEIGYAYLDVDGNGTEELLIGDGYTIFDCYTLVGGAPKLVFQGGERVTYHICSDGSIACSGSNSAFSHSDCYYTLDQNGELCLSEAVIVDTEVSEDMCFYSTTGESVEDAVLISFEEADQITSQYESMYIGLTFTPMTDSSASSANVNPGQVNDDDAYPYLREFAELMCSNPSALESEDEDERNAFLQSAKEGYDQWVAGTDYHYIVMDNSGHLTIDYDIAEAEGIVGLW